VSADPYKYFRLEARELLDGLSQGVLEIERGAPSKDPVGRLLRLAHTLKGASRVVKLVEIAKHAHAVEEALAPFRDKEGTLSQRIVDDLLHLIDAMGAQVASLDAVATKGPADAKPAMEKPFETVRVELEEMDLLLEGVTEVTVQINILCQESETLGRAHHLASALVEQLGLARAPSASAAPHEALKAHALAEELKAAIEGVGRNVSSGVEQVSRELAQVRDATNRLRLLPASAIFSPLERAARDAAEFLRKRIAFQATGGEGRLDAHVLAAVRDALLHVVRNAVAHGIEPEAERAAAGKSPIGKVTLEVDRRGSKVAFVCRDDGRGIDVENLKREAVRTGALAAAESASIGQEELFRLLLKGGLTTTHVVTEVSGRGIGLDVVRETAARLKGEVTIRSETGRGTSLEICVPVSLSSLSALVVDAAGVAAVVPLDAVRRTLRLVESEIARAPERDTIVYEGKVIPFVPLARVLRRPLAPLRERQPWSAIVVDSGSALAAVGVDTLLGTGSVVVRPLPARIEASEIVVGASLDAEGNPQLVLDPAGLVVAAQAGRGAAVKSEPRPRSPLLVVDDSLTTRMLEQSILESAGYEVDLATSAEEALTKARERRYGLFVVDVEMPGMDGFEFVARTRTDAILREIPAILVTSRASREDRRRGQEVGARGYIVKGEFDQGDLLRAIRELLG
jgi:two-component system chemotaxis sensor kinase CheA